VSVRALHSEIQDGRRITRQDRQVNTDDLGEYRMWNFQPGDYYIVAAGRSGGTAVVVGPTPPGGLAHEGFDPVYFPSTKDRASATAITLAPGQEFRADLKIQMQPAYRVRGMLRNVAPYQPVTVELVRGAGEVSANRVVVNASTGRFEVNDVVPGTYVLRAVQKAGERELRGEQEIRVESANLDGVVLELMAGVTVSGVVRAPTTPAPSQGFSHGRQYGTRVMLRPAGSSDIGMPQYNAMADDLGKFAIENVPAGRYRLQVYRFGDYMASAVSGSKDLLASELVVDRGVSSESIEIVLRNDGGSLEVKTDGVSEGAWILACPTNGGEPQRGPVSPGLGFQNLEPGDYDVFAVKDFAKLEFRNPDVVKALRGVERVHVTVGGQSTVTLKELAH
jgi:uncharacterized protein (DUF2141 family)